MHITNQEQLKKQKRKLSIMFTIILFCVVAGLQVLFLIGRYIDSSQREFRRLDLEGMPRGKMIEMMASGNNSDQVIRGQMPPIPMLVGEGKGWRLKGGNMVLYNPNQDRILVSSVGDDDATKGIIQEILKGKENQGSVIYNNSKFLFVKENVAEGNIGILFIPAQTNVSDIIKDSLLFILVFGLCSVLFYRIIYWFVGRMFVPIEENIKDMEQFIFNAGHELKTPLSVIKSHLQLALAKKEYQTAIDESVKELDKMNKLLDSLINISIVHQETEKEEINIVEETNYIVGQYSNQIKNQNINIKINSEDSYMVTSNKSHLHMFISNLISNAIKYNKKGGKIDINIASGTWEIKDTGIGIPQKDIEKIFDRFYQVGNVRNQEGFGIGLALVKKISDIYGWKIEIHSIENQGTTFVIKFQ